ncbi:MAG TPA: sugar nucleotide-binding protein [Kiritimatiellia bacterium]|nr:sugar nucleotide-binding protein [Kiritimatiellia bacterium]
MVKKEHCAVFGGSGFLGTETVRELQQSFDVTATSMRPRPSGFVSLDIRDHVALADFLNDLKPDCVAVLSAYREPDFCEDQPEETRRLNTRPLEVMCRVLPPGVPLLLVSTDYVFDGEQPPYVEDSPRNPLSEYGKSKREAEDIVLSRPGSIVLRVPLLMGWTDSAEQSGFFSQLVKDIASDEPLALDDVLKRYPVWTRDAGAGIRRLFDKKASGVFHLSTVRPLTRYQAAIEMGSLMGKSVSHISPSNKIVPRRATRPGDARLAIGKWLEHGFPPPSEFKDVAFRFLEKFKLTARN